MSDADERTGEGSIWAAVVITFILWFLCAILIKCRFTPAGGGPQPPPPPPPKPPPPPPPPSGPAPVDTLLSCTEDFVGNARRAGCTVTYAGSECGHDIWKVSCPGQADRYAVCVGTWKACATYECAKGVACGTAGGASSSTSTGDGAVGGFMGSGTIP